MEVLAETWNIEHIAEVKQKPFPQLVPSASPLSNWAVFAHCFHRRFSSDGASGLCLRARGRAIGATSHNPSPWGLASATHNPDSEDAFRRQGTAQCAIAYAGRRAVQLTLLCMQRQLFARSERVKGTPSLDVVSWQPGPCANILQASVGTALSSKIYATKLPQRLSPDGAMDPHHLVQWYV